jgi:Tol biopolymer transport system component
MVPERQPHTVLNTWQDVASYLGVSVRTAQTYEKTLGLPIRRMPGPRGRIVADPAELDRWKLQAAVPSVKPPETASRSKARLLIFAGLATGAVALLVVLLIRVRTGPTPSLLLTQITHSGFTKFAPIVSDGKQLFFTEHQNGRYWISTVSVGGGDTREFHTAIPNPYVCAISIDRKSLLVRTVGKDFNERGPLFIQPLDGSPAMPLQVFAFDGIWTPDGRSVLSTQGTEIWRVDPETKAASRFLATSGQPWWLRFSPDGKRLRFTISDLKSQELSLWEAATDGTGLRRVFEDGKPWGKGGTGSWTPDGSYFIFQGAGGIWVQDLRILAGHTPVQLTQGPPIYRGPAPSPEGRKVLARSEVPRGDLVQFDIDTGKPELLLPDKAVEIVAFAPDRRRIVTCAHQEFIVSNTDGTEPRTLLTRMIQSAFPQWSPDGKRVVVSTRRRGEPWRVSMFNMTDFSMEELTDTSINSLHPTFSPDGSHVVFGSIPSVDDAAHPLRLFLLDVSAKTAEAILGSEGLYSPSWSGSGEYIAALDSKSNHMMLYTVASKKWTRLTNDPAGYPAWANDSTAIYFAHREPDGFWFNRVDVKSGASRRLFHVEGEKLLTRWIGVHPNGSLLAARDSSVSEIFAIPF